MTDNADEPRPVPAAEPDPSSGAAADEASDLGRRPGRRPRRRVVVASGAAVGVAVVGGGLWWWASRSDPAQGLAVAVDALAAAWAGGGIADAGFSAAPGAQLPTDLPAEYARLAGPLAGTAPSVEVVSVDDSSAQEGTASAVLRVTFDLAASVGGPAGSSFDYESTVRFVRAQDADPGEGWSPVWQSAVVHPALASGATFVLDRELPARADVLGRDGSPVVTETAVVRVGVQPSRTTDVQATANSLAGILGIDAAALATRVQQASPDAFVDVITLRRSDYEAQRDQLQPVPGAVFAEGTLPLAPTRGFARALLGTVGQATAEIVEESAGRYAAGDLAGLSGVQRGYDERLAGRAGIVLSAQGGTDAVAVELVRFEAEPGLTVQTSIDTRVQLVADEALAAAPAPAALVAVDVATGQVLAAANHPVDGGDRALTGRFPPGSTFKVVTTAALLAGGLDPQETVACTPTYTVDGRSFSNFEDEAFGDVPFRTDFAMSCNTAFASLSPRLADDDLPITAAELGVGADWEAGVDAFAGDVPVAESAVDLAAASFGQGRTLVSPLAMAVAAASVAAGSLRTPVVVLDPAPQAPSAPATAADPAVLATVGDLMRDVVTAGTATVLGGVPGEPVHAKTGTAEYGTAVPPATHAWTIGFQGTLAFAVFVTDGASGGQVAAPLAADFLTRLAAAG